MAGSGAGRTRLGRTFRKVRPTLLVLVVVGICTALSIAFDKFFETYAGAVGAVALWVAIIFAVDAQRTTNEISESVSTRYVGKFPQNLRNLTALAGKARKRFFAYADCVDYGSFFEPVEFEEFLNAVRQQSAAGVKFTFLVVGKPKDISGASKGTIERYVPAYCRALRSNSDFMSALPKVFERAVELRGLGIVEFSRDVSAEDVQRFLVEAPAHDVDVKILSALLHCFHEWTRQTLEAAHVQIIVKHEQESPRFFFWLADKDEAMFELLRPTDDALGFTTHDTNLVDSFADIWDQAIA